MSTDRVRADRELPALVRRRPASTPPRGVVTAVAALAVVGCAALLWFRLTPTARDTLWAEDGRLYLLDAQRDGLAATFWPYGGYLQVVPRLIADVVVWLVPVSFWAVAMTAASCLVAGAVAVGVFFWARPVVPSALLRVVLAAPTVLLPLGPREVLGNVANLHSVLLWGLFWLVLARPATRRGAIVLGVLGTFAALSEIQAVFLLPLMAVVVRRRRESIYLVAGPVLGVAAQLIATLGAPRVQGQHAVVSTLSVAEGYVINTVLPDLTSYAGVGSLLVHGGLLIGVSIVLGVLGLAAVAFRRADSEQRIVLLAAASLSVLVYAASVLVNPRPYYGYAALPSSQLETVWLIRYGVLPGMLLLAVIIVSASVLMTDAHSTVGRAGFAAGRTAFVAGLARRILAVVALAAVLACLAFGYTPSSTRRGYGPAWSPQVAAAADACEDNPSLHVTDLEETLHWVVPVRCALLDPDHSSTR